MDDRELARRRKTIFSKLRRLTAEKAMLHTETERLDERLVELGRTLHSRLDEQQRRLLAAQSALRKLTAHGRGPESLLPSDSRSTPLRRPHRKPHMSLSSSSSSDDDNVPTTQRGNRQNQLDLSSSSSSSSSSLRALPFRHRLAAAEPPSGTSLRSRIERRPQRSLAMSRLARWRGGERRLADR